MRSRWLVMAALVAMPSLLTAGEFEWMTREFARQSGTPQLHIPFFGLARFVVATAHPAGASDLQLAVFEHPAVNGDEFSRIANSTISSRWKPVVRVHDKSGEISNIYVQPDGKHLRVLLATYSNADVVFVQLRIRPEELVHFVDQQRRKDHTGGTT